MKAARADKCLICTRGRHHFSDILKLKPPHLSARRNPSEREAGDVEWQIEANDCRPQLIAALEENIFHELDVRHAFERVHGSERFQGAALIFGKDVRIKKQACFIENLTLSKLVAAKAKPLRGVGCRFRVEDERPFGRRRRSPIT
jgi:hypothetical protein